METWKHWSVQCKKTTTCLVGESIAEVRIRSKLFSNKDVKNDVSMVSTYATIGTVNNTISFRVSQLGSEIHKK